MRRLRVGDPSGLCLACRGSLPYAASSQKRGLIQRSNTGVVLGRQRRKLQRNQKVAVELPDVVLDLDAENSPHVRPLNKKDVARQRAIWEYDPILPGVKQRVRWLQADIRKDGDKMRDMQAARHHHFKISDLDVLSVALLGGNATASALVDSDAVNPKALRHNVLLRGRDQAMKANGIPQRILDGDANTIIHFMLHRQRLASASHETAPASTKKVFDTFQGAVQDCKMLWGLERLCSHSLSSGGEAISPANMDLIARWLQNRESLLESKHHQQDALKLVNNLTMRQLSANAGLSQSLSLVGLVLAAKLGLLPAIIQYLHICLSQRFIGTSQDEPETLGAIGEGILAGLEKGDGSARGTRPELFTLLTGRTLADSTVQPALFGSSLRNRKEDPTTHHIYVQLLGQLGAYRLLWHSWKKVADGRIRHYEQFYYAALIRCVEVLRDAKSVAGLDCTTATGDLERDAELDLQGIDALDAHHASSTSPQDPYASRIENPLPWDETNKVFRSSNIHGAVARINDLITSANTASSKD